MADVKINVVAEVGQAVSDLQKVDESLGGMGKAGKSAGLSLTDLKSGLDLAMGAVKAVQAAVQSVIDPTIEYAAQVRTLGRTIGATAEESSKLIQAADDVGISAETLQGALQAAIRKGVEPTIEGIGELADEYNSIQDPIERTKFLMDNFGRSGAALAPLMEQGAEGIAAAGEEAEKFGLILSGDGVQAARDYEIAIDNVEDSLMGLKIAAGQAALPIVSSLADGLTTQIQLTRTWNEAVKLGIVTEKDWAETHHAIAAGFLTEGQVLERLNDEIAQHQLEVTSLDPVWERNQQQVEANTAAAQTYTNELYFQSVGLDETGNSLELTADAYDATAAATARAEAAASRLNMIMGGAIDNELASYEQSQADIEAQIAETRAELEKYTNLSGQTVTVITDTEEAQRNLTIAMAAQETAAGTLAEAQQKLSENTDPEKQLQLEAAVARAQGALINAQGQVGEWNATLDESGNTYVTDYTTRINEITGELYTLEEAAAANAAAHEEATEKILYGYIQQALAVDGLSLDEIHALTAIGEQWGLLKEGTTTAVDGILEAADGLANGNSLPEFMNQVNGVRDAILGVPTDITTTFHVNVDGQTPSYAGPHGGNANAFADGGNYGPGPILVGEEGPEILYPRGSGYVQNNTDMRDMLEALQAIARNGTGGGGNTYVVNGTYANQDGGTVAQELALMDRLYR